MSRKLYISDQHFGHENIIKFGQRPFKNAAEMDKEMVRRWNEAVNPEDTVYVLGDIGMSRKIDKDYVKELFTSMNGTKILIIGNHDQDFPITFLKQIFAAVKPLHEISDMIGDKKYKVTLCHYPMMQWNRSHIVGQTFESVHLFGHVHNMPDYHVLPFVMERSYNVGADILDFTPRTLDEVIKMSNEWAAKIKMPIQKHILPPKRGEK